MLPLGHRRDLAGPAGHPRPPPDMAAQRPSPAAFAITQIIVVPLAAAASSRPRSRSCARKDAWRWRARAQRVGVAAIPLALWVLSNLWRYHWPVPRSLTGVSGGGFSGARHVRDRPARSSPARTSRRSTRVSRSRSTGGSSAPTPGTTARSRAVHRVTLVGVAVALFRGIRARSDTPSGSSSIAVVTAHFTVFCMLYLAIILTGGGDFVYRYFSAEQAAAACLAGTCFAGALPQSDAAAGRHRCCSAWRSPTGRTTRRRSRRRGRAPSCRAGRRSPRAPGSGPRAPASAASARGGRARARPSGRAGAARGSTTRGSAAGPRAARRSGPAPSSTSPVS